MCAEISTAATPQPILAPSREREYTVAHRASRRTVVSPLAYSFGRRLRDERQSRGITLEAIAATTKISVSLLAALECGDVSTWPGGIFRRAFVRAYATAIGVSPEPIVAELTRLFPEESRVGNASAPAPTNDFRLSLAIDHRWATRDVLIRVVTALLEACLIIAIAHVVAWLGGADAWTICSIVAVTYYSLAAACLGRSLGSWSIQSGFHSYRKPVRRIAAEETGGIVPRVTRSSPPRESVVLDSTGGLAPLRATSR
jgi:transcriptional regulator with XRE-family HTH domain